MSLSLLTYLLLLVLSFVASLVVLKKEPYVRYFSILLAISIITEICAIIVYRMDESVNDYNIVYHVYLLIEFPLIVFILTHFIESEKIKLGLRWSIPLFWMASLAISFYTTFLVHPAWNLNLSGLVIILICFYVIFNISPHHNKSIFALPVFWFCMGWIFYVTGTFIYNFLYQYLLDIGRNELAEMLQRLLIRTFNRTLYIAIIIGFICLKRIRK